VNFFFYPVNFGPVYKIKYTDCGSPISVYKTGSPGLLRLSHRNNDTASCDLHVWFQVRILLQLPSHVSRYNGSVSADKIINILNLKNIPYSRVDVSLKSSFLAQLLKSNIGAPDLTSS
jgi:hypothetical protein